MSEESESHIFELVQRVKDKETFIEFVKALAQESEEADKLSEADPERFKYDAPLGWQNGDISSFLLAGLESFQGGWYRAAPSDEPSWKTFAEFLYFGKIYE